MAAALVQQLRDVVLGDGSIEDELAAVDAGKAAYPADRRALAAVQFNPSAGPCTHAACMHPA